MRVVLRTKFGYRRVFYDKVKEIRIEIISTTFLEIRSASATA